MSGLVGTQGPRSLKTGSYFYVFKRFRKFYLTDRKLACVETFCDFSGGLFDGVSVGIRPGFGNHGDSENEKLVDIFYIQVIVVANVENKFDILAEVARSSTELIIS